MEPDFDELEGLDDLGVDDDLDDGAAPCEARARDPTTPAGAPPPLDGAPDLWNKDPAMRAYEHKLFRELMSAVEPEHVAPGLACEHAPLSNVWAWAQTKGAIVFAVWVQGPLDELEVELLERPARIRVQSRGFAPALERAFAGEVAVEHEMDSVSWDALEIIVFKLAKARYGERWTALFEGDTHMLRAVDWGHPRAYSWAPNGDEPDEPSMVVTVDVPAGTRKEHVRVAFGPRDVLVAVAGVRDWRRTYKYRARAHECTWCLTRVDDDAAAAPRSAPPRWAVQLTLYFAELPRKRVVYDRAADGRLEELGELVGEGRARDARGAVVAVPATAVARDAPDHDVATLSLMLEDEDSTLTKAMTELMMHLTCGETFRDGRVENLGQVTQLLLRQLPASERPKCGARGPRPLGEYRSSGRARCPTPRPFVLPGTRSTRPTKPSTRSRSPSGGRRRRRRRPSGGGASSGSSTSPTRRRGRRRRRATTTTTTTTCARCAGITPSIANANTARRPSSAAHALQTGGGRALPRRRARAVRRAASQRRGSSKSWT